MTYYYKQGLSIEYRLFAKELYSIVKKGVETGDIFKPLINAHSKDELVKKIKNKDYGFFFQRKLNKHPYHLDKFGDYQFVIGCCHYFLTISDKQVTIDYNPNYWGINTHKHGGYKFCYPHLYNKGDHEETKRVFHLKIDGDDFDLLKGFPDTDSAPLPRELFLHFISNRRWRTYIRDSFQTMTDQGFLSQSLISDYISMADELTYNPSKLDIMENFLKGYKGKIYEPN